MEVATSHRDLYPTVVRILVTGFEGFEGVPSNPTERLVAGLPAEIGGCAIDTAVLPVDMRSAPEHLRSLLHPPPAAAIHLGVAARRRQISLETRAVNWMAFEVPDNAGRIVSGEVIKSDAPPMLPTRLPVDDIERALRQSNIPCGLSRDAGRYICNLVMYESLRTLPAHVPTGFVHVPPDDDLADELGRHHYLSNELMLEAIVLAIEATIGSLETSARV